MSKTLKSAQTLVALRDVRISEHGYDEMAADGISVGEILAGIKDAVLIEDYPEYGKGPCVLVLQKDRMGLPVHAVWGIPKNTKSPAVLVTAYRPDPERWEEGFLRRKS